MKVVNLNQRSPQWHAWRSKGVTASDAAILLGLSPHKTFWRLWAEKTGYAEPDDLSRNPNVIRGVQYEDEARQAYEDKHNELLLPVCAESESEPLIRASLDGLDSRSRPIELKCPALSTWDEVKQRGHESEAYKLYYPQVQHQLMVTGASDGVLVFYNTDTKQMMEFSIAADHHMQAELLKRATELWDFVQKRKEPPKDPERDVFIPNGSQADAWINAAEGYRVLEQDVVELKNRLKELQERQKPYVEAMRALMGEHYSGEFCGVLVTRYKSQGRVDYKQIVEDRLQLTSDDVEAFRGESSERCRITVTDSLLPRNIVDPSVVELLEDVEETAESFWF